jgi:MFS family permease
MSWLNADGRMLLVTRALRTFGYGYLAVILAIYLEALGLEPLEIGFVLTAALAGSAVMTVFWSLVADRFGRRRTVATMACLMLLGGLVFATTSSFWVLLVAGFTGTISATNSEVGPFITVEQAILPQTAPDHRRTWLFSVYDTIGTLAGAVGALFAGTVRVWSALGLGGADAYRPLFVLYGLIGAANVALFLRLSDGVEVDPALAAPVDVRRRFGVHRSAGIVARLASLFALDAFAGALVVPSLVSYWFHLQWGLSLEVLAVFFFWVNVVSGLSLLVAGWLAGRFGLLNTMVFSHLPSNVLLMLVPLMPTAWLAVLVFLLRVSVSQMDVPTRKSFTMAVVDPDERTAAAGLTNVARTSVSAVSPLISGAALAAAAVGLPFYLAGALKIAYDLLMYGTFRDVHPPEELRRLTAAPDSAGVQGRRAALPVGGQPRK